MTRGRTDAHSHVGKCKARRENRFICPSSSCLPLFLLFCFDMAVGMFGPHLLALRLLQAWLRRRLVWNDRLYPSRQTLSSACAFGGVSSLRRFVSQPVSRTRGRQKEGVPLAPTEKQERRTNEKKGTKRLDLLRKREKESVRRFV